jgi:hypothetical protein
MRGEIKVTLNKDKAVFVNNLLRIMVPTIDLYNKLKNSFNLLINDLNLISNHMKEISILFEKLSIQAKDIKQSENMKKMYSNLNNIFSTWSKSYLTQSKFFKDDFLEYFSVEKPEPITKIKTKTFKELKKIAMNRIHKRYGANAKLKYQYIGLIMENLIFNKNTHLVSTFKDYMIWDYVEEFLKRFYNDKESGERVPKFASFYKNYLKFFCIPTFKDIFSNEMIHNFNEKKAELFYNENYKKKKETNSYQED